MGYELILKETTYNVEAFDFIEYDGEITGRKCRLLCLETNTNGIETLIVVRLNYPPFNYRKKLSSRVASAIDSAFEKQLELYSSLYQNNRLDMDKELDALPKNILKYFDILIKAKHENISGVTEL